MNADAIETEIPALHLINIVAIRRESSSDVNSNSDTHVTFTVMMRETFLLCQSFIDFYSSIDCYLEMFTIAMLLTFIAYS